MTGANSIRNSLQNVLLVLAATLLPLLALEAATRLYRGTLFANHNEPSAEDLAGPRAEYDSQLGYLPITGKRVGRITATIGDHGLRLHSDLLVSADPFILAVGDSYTFGDDVGDRETWPAHLQQLMQAPVYNGGVFGYGLDQTILRTEHLLDIYQPQILIVSMIADDLNRSELAYRYSWKPYFDIVKDELILRNVPVPELPPPVRFRAARDLLRHSELADAIFVRVAEQWWRYEGSEQRVHSNGERVGQLLMHRLAQRVAGLGIRTVVVAQADRSLDTVSLLTIVEAARAAGLEAIDLATPLAAMIAQAPEMEEQLFLGPFGGHMTSAGNRWIAERLLEHIEQNQ